MKIQVVFFFERLKIVHIPDESILIFEMRLLIYLSTLLMLQMPSILDLYLVRITRTYKESVFNLCENFKITSEI